jgi:hypothetical protein
MIISASYRTDIPAYFGAWFKAGLARQYVTVKNPYNNQESTVSLAPDDVDAYVFWTRNVAGFLMQLDDLYAAKVPFVIQYTVTGYPGALERATPHWGRAVELMRVCARRYGKRAVVWRYDPIVFTSCTDAMFHRRNFARIAANLKNTVDEVVISFMEPYVKTRRNLNIAAAASGFTWHVPGEDERHDLLADLSMIAEYYGIRMTSCAQVGLRIDAANCIDTERLSDIAGREIKARAKGNRPNCKCAESRDIGAYDTCAQGCTYCYAVGSRSVAMERMQRVRPEDTALTN